MSRMALRTTFVLLVLLPFRVAFAQEAITEMTAPPGGPVITGIASAERVRFTAPNTVVQMHLQVYDNGGQLVFNLSSRGNVLDWTLQDSGGARLNPGSYISVVTVKSLSGKLSQRIGKCAREAV